MKLFRKIATVFAVAALMVSAAGNAMAYFETTTTTTRLIRVAYDLSKSTERLTDLGDINTIISSAADGADIYGSGVNSILGGTLATSSLSNVNVAYFACTISNNDLWLATNNNSQNATYTLWASTKSAINAVSGYYRTLATSPTIEGSTAYAKSYYSMLDGVGVKVGSYNNLIGIGHGEINLASLATNNPISMNLFFWDNPGVADAGSLVSKGTYKQITISTLADGSTMVASAVPIPPAFFLMGSGLLGMIGLRRRMA